MKQKTEKWKQVEGFERYLVSNTGRVISTLNKKSKELKPQQDAIGYLHYRLYPEDARFGFYPNGRGVKPKLFKAHKLVLETFSPTLDTTLEVNHKDGDKHNNCISNLEWVTRSENIQHSWDIGRRVHTHKKIARCNRKPIVAVHKDGTCRYFKGNIVAKFGIGCSLAAIANSLKDGKYIQKGPAEGYKFIRPTETIEEYQYEDVLNLEQQIDELNERLYGKKRKQLLNTKKYGRAI